MKAAIYARKSTNDNDRNEDNKSVTRQVEGARAFARSRNWTVDDQHVYIDDGISGAEYQNRPGFTTLLSHLKEFDALIMSESSRLGRDMLRNAYYIGEILESGVQIFYYLTGDEERADTPEQKIMVTLKSYASEVERQKASQRSYDALRRKAEKGYNTGGVVYGYNNVEVTTTAINGETIKSHTDYEINQEQAAVICSIFRMYADGCGYTTIAKTLNRDPRYHRESLKYFGGLTPAPPRKGTGSWAPSSIRAMLYNERYTGKIPFGLYRKVYRRGTKKRDKQNTRRLLVDRPDLRIVPDHLWRDVQHRLQSVVKTYIGSTDGRLWGRPGLGAESKYLLTGNARCDCCDANISVLSRASGKGRLYYYGCGYHRNRGTTVCSNNHIERMEIMDNAVLKAIEQKVLTSDAVDYVIDKAIKLIEQRRGNRNRPGGMRAEIRNLRGELENLLRLAANGTYSESLGAEIIKREERIKTLELEQVKHAIKIPGEIEVRRLKKTLRERMGRFKELLYGDVPKARQALRKLLEEPLRFIPREHDGRKTYSFEGKTRVGALLDPLYLGVASPTGEDGRGRHTLYKPENAVPRKWSVPVCERSGVPPA